ncbi:hypothetical protein KCU93_g52, partial [Aureobasidium melanogenum]
MQITLLLPSANPSSQYSLVSRLEDPMRESTLGNGFLVCHAVRNPLSTPAVVLDVFVSITEREQSIESRIGLAQNCVSEAGNHSSALECAPQVILDVFFRKVVADVVSHLQHPTKHFLCCETVERTRKALQASRATLQSRRSSRQRLAPSNRPCSFPSRELGHGMHVRGEVVQHCLDIVWQGGLLGQLARELAHLIGGWHFTFLPLGSCSWQSLMVRPWKRIPSFASRTDPSQIMAVRPLVALSSTRQTSLKQRSLPHSTQGVLNFDATNALGCMALDLLEELAFGRDDLCEGMRNIEKTYELEQGGSWWPVHSLISTSNSGRCGEDTSLQPWGESTSVGSFGYDAPGVMDLWPQYPHADGNKET